MIIECLPKTGTDIKNGFNCNFDGALIGSSSLTIQKVENGDNDFYINNVWSNGELIISLLLMIMIIFSSFAWLFSFIFPNNKIKIIKRDA